MKLFVVGCCLLFCLGVTLAQDIPAWRYECQQNRCVKMELNQSNIDTAISLPVCRLFCGENVPVWPKPTETIRLDPSTVRIKKSGINFRRPSTRSVDSLWSAIENRFTNQIEAKVAHTTGLKDEGKNLIIKFSVNESSNYNLESYTDERYKLSLSQTSNEAIAEIKAETIYGARHGLETLSQLIVYDDIRRELQVVAEGEISDSPVYKHRGLLLDTSRNYFSVESLKRLIDAMAIVKLNVFHWHITDSHSFPLVLKSHPDLTKYGAYTPKKVYTPESIRDLVQYARVRGVRVLPEFDAPAHVGEGWQKKDMTACFNKQPWQDYCVEPPCGQLDPTVDGLYDVLEDIYREMYDYFDSPDIFHMGGDEVSTGCWNSSERIQKWMLAKGWKLEEKDFIELWGYFQDNALERFDKVAGRKLPIIMWTSHLTEKPFVDKYLDKSRYIIQIWTTGADPKVQDLLELGYKLIVSNYDALYLDCGFGGWVNDGNNWCSPFIGWQKVYDNRPDKIAGQYPSQILGSEAALWAEQVDEYTLDSRFWPRASALAERLWSNPDTTWREAESRMLMHRERLVENGIGAEALQPEWCLQNENDCPIIKSGA
ncbi:chitooligosaccharidolytic beta-N-acetylglucosaminidase isoform X3 [Hermetia illucens]|uniref:chitooligosaccharidolytic beta-N-acetylglucosaminidase isoform X3 n=1 Tax=Hermetia illucens TaxID=343691 RepID=UPI0018CC34B2|nr:chitooligosaccharidolytic beta-N-acetylglucosaminidase isoform X3 [Hermetia illucens]XP_037908556.1 chitooligosaccharidolytic beta-N-acetylglucosaminidase isoform X3 [Hermetia illucens]